MKKDLKTRLIHRKIKKPDPFIASIGMWVLGLLKKVTELVREHGKTLQNCDITVIAQAPKLSPFIVQMRENLANAMGEDIEKISIKATTEEGLGFTGSGEGISAQAICLLTSPFDLTAQQIAGGCEGCGGCKKN